MPPSTNLSLQELSRAMQPMAAMSLNHFLPEVALTVGFLLVVLVDLFIRRDEGRRIAAYLSLLTFAVAGYFAIQQWVPYVASGSEQWEKGGSMIFRSILNLPGGYGMLVVDNFSVFFKLLIAASGIFIILMSLNSNEVEGSKSKMGEYYSLMVAMALGMFLMPASTDLIMMYISLEMVSITSYIMAGFLKGSHRSAEASMKYVLFGAFSSGLMLYGFSILYGMTGTTNIIAIQHVLATQINPATGHLTSSAPLWIALILSLAGMGYKISAAPFHFWTPDVYEGAPIPVTALLSVASKAAGFGLLMRFLFFAIPARPQMGMNDHWAGYPVIDWPILIAVISAVTMTLGNFAALQQSNVKRMLAYSTIAHAGYMLIGLVAAAPQLGMIGLGTTYGAQGIVSILVYLVAYLFMSIGAFYAVMLIANKAGSEEIEDYRGFAKRSPLLAVALSVMLISLTGIPLTIGFVGKLYIFTSIIRIDPATGDIRWLWLAVVAILNSVVSLYYYIRVMAAMFIKQPEPNPLVTSGMAGGVIAMDSISYSLGTKALLFAFIIPVMFFGIYFTPILDFTSNVVRFFSVK